MWHKSWARVHTASRRAGSISMDDRHQRNCDCDCVCVYVCLDAMMRSVRAGAMSSLFATQANELPPTCVQRRQRIQFKVKLFTLCANHLTQSDIFSYRTIDCFGGRYLQMTHTHLNASPAHTHVSAVNLERTLGARRLGRANSITLAL